MRSMIPLRYCVVTCDKLRRRSIQVNAALTAGQRITERSPYVFADINDRRDPMRLTNNCFKFLALPFLAGLFMSFGSENPPYQGGRREEISCKALLGGPLTPGPSPPMGARGKKSLELTPSPPLGVRVAEGRVRGPIIFILD